MESSMRYIKLLACSIDSPKRRRLRSVKSTFKVYATDQNCMDITQWRMPVGYLSLFLDFFWRGVQLLSNLTKISDQ